MLETQQYRYQTAISDMSNSDIAVHNGDPRAVVTEVRNWLNDQAGLQAPGPSSIWGAFLDFMADNYETLKQRGFSDRDIEKLPINELMQCIERWAKKHTEKPSNRRRKIRR